LEAGGFEKLRKLLRIIEEFDEMQLAQKRLKQARCRSSRQKAPTCLVPGFAAKSASESQPVPVEPDVK